MISEKDAVINLLKDEVIRKNDTIKQLIERQVTLENKLAKIEGVLSYEEDDQMMLDNDDMTIASTIDKRNESSEETLENSDDEISRD